MNEAQARAQGYEFTGIYDHSYHKDEVMARRDAEFTKKGYKAVVCYIPSDPLSRGHSGGGYSVYAERKYFVDRDLETIRKQLEAITSRNAYAKKEYEKALKEIADDQKRMLAREAELATELTKIQEGKKA